jgi:hypothetical protein
MASPRVLKGLALVQWRPVLARFPKSFEAYFY